MHYNTIDYRTHFISDAIFYLFQHQGAIIREGISNKGLYVQQVFQTLFAITPIIKVKSLKMLKLQTTHQQVYVHNAVTTPHSD